MTKPPIGFEDQHLPEDVINPPEIIEEPNFDDFADDTGFDTTMGTGYGATTGFDDFDPVAMGFHDGSLVQSLAYAMNTEVEKIRDT